MEDRLYNDPRLAAFYDLDNDGGPDHDYCAGLAAGARSVLDLGCGTGQLAVRLAKGRRVVAVDPASAMLDIARRRTGGSLVEWVGGDARTIRLNRRFDLVLLTGHAFQVFLSGSDRKAVLRTIRQHLEPGGRFVFDTRNPAAREWTEWTPERSLRELEHPRHGSVLAWNEASHNAARDIVTYHTFYRLASTGEVASAESHIAFPSHEQVVHGLAAAGLTADQWLGSWAGEDYGPARPEIIPVGRAGDD